MQMIIRSAKSDKNIENVKSKLVRMTRIAIDGFKKNYM